MIDKWAHVGHKLGECWVSPAGNITYIHIPKNASSRVKGCVASNQWQHSDTLVNSDQFLVILRDPIDRWCSGIAQFQLNNQQLELDVAEVFNRITFDDHTEQQIYFLQTVDLNKVTFIMIDDEFDNTFNHWLVENGYPKIDNTIRFNQSDGIKLELKQKYQRLIDSTPEYMLQLKKHFANDYALIHQVKFYD